MRDEIRWIELHKLDGRPVLINVQNITQIWEGLRYFSENHEEQRVVTIAFCHDNCGSGLNVTESYDEVKKYLEQAGTFPRWESEFDA